MNHHISTCPACGGPIFGSLLNSSHQCRPTPFTVVYQAPRTIVLPIETAKPSLSAADLADNITPGEASRLCSRIRQQIEEHSKYCAFCSMQLQNYPCTDMPALQQALEHWEEYTKIEVDRK